MPVVDYETPFEPGSDKSLERMSGSLFDILTSLRDSPPPTNKFSPSRHLDLSRLQLATVYAFGSVAHNQFSLESDPGAA